MHKPIRVADAIWEIPQEGSMRVPGRIYATDALLAAALDDEAVTQVANVASLPGIVDFSIAMPDIHWGYGFPIGGVAATDVDNEGVVSPGGVGFDICCGVRLLATELLTSDFHSHRDRVMAELADNIPRGLGKGAIADPSLVRRVLVDGAVAAVEIGLGEAGDIERCEEAGKSAGADPDSLSQRALDRGADQLGSLGGGNHFLEVQEVEEVFDFGCAEAFGLRAGTVAVMIHCGSRGLGHQTCQDHLKLMGPAMSRHGIEIPDRQLACVPVRSPEGESYLSAMATAANFAWANRQVLADATRQAFRRALGRRLSMPLVFDVAHNLAKIEEHNNRLLCVHRKGATRAFAAGHQDLPEDLRDFGQPVLVPGSMGTSSWVLVGLPGNSAFASAAHGAGRLMSRKQAVKVRSGAKVHAELEEAGISIRPQSVGLLSEEAPYAYKDVDEVALACEIAGLARRVARLRPLGVIKG